jgi:hypothetical protein
VYSVQSASFNVENVGSPLAAIAATMAGGKGVYRRKAETKQSRHYYHSPRSYRYANQEWQLLFYDFAIKDQGRRHENAMMAQLSLVSV